MIITTILFSVIIQVLNGAITCELTNRKVAEGLGMLPENVCLMRDTEGNVRGLMNWKNFMDYDYMERDGELLSQTRRILAYLIHQLNERDNHPDVRIPFHIPLRDQEFGFYEWNEEEDDAFNHL
jgi:hypothetical protein